MRMLSLFAISAVAGIAMLWVFGRVSNQAAIRQAKNRLKAHMLELRLFADEPALVWQAQKKLLAANGRFLFLTLKPMLVLALPMIGLIWVLDPFYARDPLRVGEATVLTAQMKNDSVPPLETPDALGVETPPVRVLANKQVSWRVRAGAPFSGSVKVGGSEKRIEAGTGMRYARERQSGRGDVEWIEIRYPSARLRFLGVELHWLVWFFIFSMLSALLMKRRLGVAF